MALRLIGPERALAADPRPRDDSAEADAARAPRVTREQTASARSLDEGLPPWVAKLDHTMFAEISSLSTRRAGDETSAAERQRLTSRLKRREPWWHKVADWG